MNGAGHQQSHGGYGLSRMSMAGPGPSMARAGPPARHSLAPGRVMRSGPGGMAGLPDSMAGMSLGGPSDARMQGIGRNMGAMSARRSSQYTGRPSTIGAPMAITKAMKDPRAIRDKTWQANAVRALIKFLVERGYNQPLAPQAIMKISATAFESIFKFLTCRIDPEFVFQKNLDEEVPAVLRGLHYPYADGINKSQLHSTGSSHTWPTIFASLHWLMELVAFCEIMEEEIETNDGICAVRAEGDTEDFDTDRIFWLHSKDTYLAFMGGDDDYEAMDQRLLDDLAQRHQKDDENLARLREEREGLDAELKDLTESESPAVALERDGRMLREDKEKFIQYIRHVENKIQKVGDSILALKEDLEAREKEAEELAEEKAQLQRTVDAQEISPADVDRMTAEREQLNQTLAAVAEKMETANKALWEKEISQQKSMDALEKVVQEYNALAYLLGILGSSAGHRGSAAAALKDFPSELAAELELRVHAARPEQMVSLDLRGKVKPALLKLRAGFNRVHHMAQDELIALQETIDALVWSQARKKEELVEMESRVKQLTDQYKQDQEQIGAANGAGSEEIHQYERNIQRIKIESNGELIQSQQKMQKAISDYEQLYRKVTADRESQLNEIAQAVVSVFGFHQHVQKQLEELQKDANAYYDEIVREC
ncbi:kinetochore-associated Ndc80 complex subunit ndc80 [Geranomyces michiganensis]|nr:kinetochore-associated Ndc80 complex subunit ndc80 [Geranomyces michiganensis]